MNEYSAAVDSSRDVKHTSKHGLSRRAAAQTRPGGELQVLLRPRPNEPDSTAEGHGELQLKHSDFMECSRGVVED